MPALAVRVPKARVSVIAPARRHMSGGHRSNHVATQLLDSDDVTAFALNPSDPRTLHEVCNAVDAAIADGVNERTSKGEDSAWNRYYVPFCRKMRTAVWRTYEAALNPRREAAFACGLVMHVWESITPRTKADKQARVDSVRNIVAHVRRRHARRGYSFATSNQLAHVFKGLSRRRVRQCGVPTIRRAEPYTVDELVAMKSPPDGVRIGKRVYDPTDVFWSNWRLVDTYTDQTGTRKSEIVGFEDVCFRHSDCVFVIDGKQYPDVGPAELERLRLGQYKVAYVTVAVNISKADSDGSKFGPSLVSLLYNPRNPMSFAVALADHYRLFPVRGAASAATPLFTTDGVRRWTASQLDATLSGVMAVTLTAAQRKHKTMHSKRVFCATGFRDIKSSDGEIQALVRWSSLESLRIYARMGLEYQAMRRDALLAARVDAMNAAARSTLPVVDPEDDLPGTPAGGLGAAAALADLDELAAAFTADASP